VPLLVFAAGWVLLCPFAFALHGLVRLPLARVRAKQRSTLLLALAVLPPLVSVSATLLAFLPLDTTLIDRYCRAAACTLLRSSHTASIGAAVFVAAASLLWVWIERLPRGAAGIVVLAASPEARSTMSYEIDDSLEPFARATGWLRPRLIVSRGLLDTVAPPHLAVLIAHAEGEVLRRDPLRMRCAALALAPLTKLSGALLRELRTANQQDCDAAATLSYGASTVIATLNAIAAETEPGPVLQSLAERVLAIALPPPWTLPPIAIPLAVLGVYTVLTVPGIAAARELALLISSWLA
jgi:Zn-dependent protease with chaperone function